MAKSKSAAATNFKKASNKIKSKGRGPKSWWGGLRIVGIEGGGDLDGGRGQGLHETWQLEARIPPF